MTNLLPPIIAAQEALYQAAGYATAGDTELAQYMVWQAKQFLKPIRRPSLRAKTSTRARGGVG